MVQNERAGLSATSAPSLLASGALSFATSAAPLIVALIALPILTRHLGTERLGLLALSWAWLGYATLLDFGLGRALTRMVAASDAGTLPDVPIGAYIATAHVTLTVVGIIVGVSGAILAPWYVTAALEVAPSILDDARTSAVLFALTVPAVTGASVPRAVLEAKQQFRSVNLIRLPVSVGTFAVPVLLLPFTASLTVIALTLAVVRLWAWWRYSVLAARLSRPRSAADKAQRSYLRPLFRAGAWMTISNVISPLINVADRFLIGAIVSIGAVAIYSVPWEAITKLWIVPGALTMVLFPTLSRLAGSDATTLAVLHSATVRLLTCIVAPICAAACILAPWLLLLVGGADYADTSADLLRILAVGVAANSIAAIPYTLLQASGHARVTASLHLIEIVPFVVCLWFGVTRYGVYGAAVVWTARAVIDAALMAFQAQRVAAVAPTTLLMNICGVALVATAAALGALTHPPLRVAIPLALMLLVVAPLALWMQRDTAERHILEQAGSRA
jgi:O-antigen/teichoic acid export membrane protein